MKRARGKAFPWPGQDSRSADTFDACVDRCEKTKWCMAFTYFKEAEECKMMKTTDEPVQHLKADSGYKSQRPANSPPVKKESKEPSWNPF